MAAGRKHIRNGSIDLMKFGFTLLVMMFHTTKLFKGGYIAVDFFFIVSGFLMAKSMESRMMKEETKSLGLGTDTLSFLLRKAKGIFPYYVSAFVLSFVIGSLILDRSWKDAIILLFRSPYNLFMLEMAGNYDMGHRLQASWYISAMLLAMLFVYPIRKKKTNLFDLVIAPILFLAFVGWAYQTKTGVSGFTVGYQSDLHIYNGLIRGIAEISIGCTCFTAGKKLNDLDFTVVGKIIISLIEWCGYAVVIFCAYRYAQSDIDLVLLLIIAVSVTLSFSGKGILTPIMNNRVFSYLGSFSLQMYLMHEFVKNQIFPFLRKTTNISVILDRSLGTYLIGFVCATVVAAAVCRLLGKFLEWFAPKFVLVCKKVLIKA